MSKNAYQVIARRWRPKQFSELVGQDHVVQTLGNAIKLNRIAHAYLFVGPRGTGKTTSARLFAKSLNWEDGPTLEVPESSEIGNAIMNGRCLDVIEIDGASNNSVDQVRDLRDEWQYAPSQCRCKIYVIDEVHMLSMASFNALLKTLEEPPEHVKFLLATTDPKKVPVTVLSRCLQFQLKNLSAQMISDYLVRILADENVEFESAGVDILAKSAQGSMRDALSLTDQTIAFGQGKLLHADVVGMLGVVGHDEVRALLEAIAEGSAAKAMDISAQLAERNNDFADVLKGLLEALHEMAVDQAVNAAQTLFGTEEVQLYYQIVLVGLRDLEIAPDPRSGFEMTLLRMLAFAPKPDSGVPPRAQQSATEASAVGIESGHPADANTEAGLSAIANPGRPEQDGSTALMSAVSAETEQSSSEGFVAEAQLLAQWYEWVEQINVSGVAKMIAEHSVLKSLQLPTVEVVLSDQHDTLLNDGQRSALARALAELLGEELELQVSTAPIASETPNQFKARLAQERQSDAEAALQQDTTVQGLLNEFGGKIEAVRPR